MTPPRLSLIQRQLGRLARLLERAERLDRRFFWLRLDVFLLGGLALALAAFSGRQGAALWTILIWLTAFSVVVAFHRRLDGRVRRLRLSQAWWTAQAARLELDWQALPPALDLQADRLHPFEKDLDLSGEHSLLRLLDTGYSLGGGRRLHDWLTARQPDPAAIAARQALAGELAAQPGFRSRLALNSVLAQGPSGGSQPGLRWQVERLLAWLAASPTESLRPFLLLLAALATLNLALFALTLWAGWPPYGFFSLAAYALLYLAAYRHMPELFGQAYELNKSMRRLQSVLGYLERYPYRRGSALAGLAAAFTDPAACPSHSLRQAGLILSGASLQGNPLIWTLVNALLPWDLYFAHRLNGLRAELGRCLPAWLEAWYDLEALCSLANFAWLNPQASFPRLVPLDGREGAPVLLAHALGHPLISWRTRAVNDFEIERLGEIGLITGSNMSGKSTFLRTLGVNLALANAGGPVLAARFECLPMRLFTCIQVSDSLSDGISYFYAEVRRLKALLAALQDSQPFPLFYLIDEIFRGTNNRERQIGSRAYVQALAGSGRDATGIHAIGAGLISTHDLELVQLGRQIPGLRNYHFRESVQDRRMLFDYRLRPGPSPTSNALRIMQLEGLPVEPGDPSQ